MCERLHLLLMGAVVWLMPPLAAAESEPGSLEDLDKGVSRLWVLCNVSHAGMRAQWRP
jgi:hypothetical protein